MRNPILLLLIIHLIACSYDCDGAIKHYQNEKLEKRKRSYVIKDTTQTKLAAHLIADTIQKNSSGIRFSIKIINSSNEDILIHNPVDAMNVNLYTSSGASVLYPHVNSIWINPPLIKYPISFDIERIEIKEKESKIVINNLSDIKSEVEKENFTIASNSELEILFRIDKVLKPNVTKPYTIDERVTLSADIYRLRVTQHLWVRMPQHLGGDIKTNMFRFEPVFINYQQ